MKLNYIPKKDKTIEKNHVMYVSDVSVYYAQI